MPSLITSPQSSGQVITIPVASSLFKSTPIPSLEIGENVQAFVLTSSHDQKALLQIKNSSLLAHTPLPLQRGETLTVRVDQINPLVILRIIPHENAEISKVNEFIKFYRSNPFALKEMLTAIKFFLNSDSLNELTSYFTKKDIQNMMTVLDKVIISPKNMNNPRFLRDSITALGLDGEWRLAKGFMNQAILADAKHSLSFKEICLKLSSELTPTHITNKPIDRDHHTISQFSHFVDRAVKVIESLQIVNILANEWDGLFVLPFPLQFPGEIRMQDLFIEVDRKKVKQGAEKQYRFVFFLDMDTLGELAVDAGIQGKTLRCSLKCSDQYVVDFIQSLISELHKRMTVLNYTISLLECVLDTNVKQWKHDFLQNHKLYSQSVVDVCI